jgi:hypothetical protein
MRTRTKRFSVSVTEADYKKLRAVAKKHRPPLTLQYLPVPIILLPSEGDREDAHRKISR